MAQIKDFLSAGTLTGNELVPISQSDNTRKTTLSDLKTFVINGASLGINDNGTSGNTIETYSINKIISLLSNKQNNIIISLTTPTSPTKDDLWIDVTTTPYILKCFNGTEFISVGSAGGGTQEILIQSTQPTDTTKLWVDTSSGKPVLTWYDGNSWCNNYIDNSQLKHSTDCNETGSDANAFGTATTASGDCSFAEGSGTTASSNFSHAEGYGTNANGWCAHSEGYSTTAGQNSHAEGSGTTASGYASHSSGSYTTASGDCSFAEGSGTNANIYNSHVMGQYNKVLTGNTDSYLATADAFVIGNGTDENTTNNAFRVTFNGATYGLSAFNSSGADYSEYFEFADRNVNKEDRVGYFVTLEGDKIRKANSTDNYILGIVSATPSVIGDSCQDDWNEKYLKDDWGRIQYHDIEVPETKDKDGKVIREAHTDTVPILNPNWDYTKEYIPREKRPEWSPIGMMGKLLVRDDGTCEINGYCKSNDDGIATKSETGYRVIGRINDNIIKVLFR